MALKRFLFSTYSFFTSLGWKFMDIFPPFIRNIFFKIFLHKMGENVNIDYDVYMRYLNHIEIGDNVWINRGSQIYASHYFKNVKITLGNHVTVGPNVHFYAAGHNTHTISLADTAASIVVNDDVWICADSTILQGVTIGEGAVVAAGSVVTKNVAPFTIVGGYLLSRLKIGY